MGVVAVVLLARRQGEVAVGVELERRGKHDRARPACVLAAAAALQWQQRLYTSYNMRSIFLVFIILLISVSDSSRNAEYLIHFGSRNMLTYGASGVL